MELDVILAAAGVPKEWREDFKDIAWCESKWTPAATGDDGQSLGLFQIWVGWFDPDHAPLDLWADPVVSARLAVYIRHIRGRYGGRGGWSCADLLGIY